MEQSLEDTKRVLSEWLADGREWFDALPQLKAFGDIGVELLQAQLEVITASLYAVLDRDLDMQPWHGKRTPSDVKQAYLEDMCIYGITDSIESSIHVLNMAARARERQQPIPIQVAKMAKPYTGPGTGNSPPVYLTGQLFGLRL